MAARRLDSVLYRILLIPFLWWSFRVVKKYGTEKNAVCAENVSSIIEYVSEIQTFRTYGIGGTKNKTIIAAMKECNDGVKFDDTFCTAVGHFNILQF